MYENINSPISIGGLTLKNRIIFAPTSMGLPREEYVKKLEAIGAGGVAMIIVGDVPAGKSWMNSLYSKKGFDYYRQVTEAVHKSGALCGAQLHVSDSNIKGMLKYLPGMLRKKYSPDELRVLLNGLVGDYINGLSVEKVGKITTSFGAAAVLAKKAGFDMVQIHGDRMCGSFASGVFNKRADRYGGSVENRIRFAVEAVEAVRSALPDMPIDFKLAVRQEQPHYGNAGILFEELAEAVPMLCSAGVDSFHVALANHSNLSDTIPSASHPYFHGEGCFLKFCSEVKQYTALPVCGVGGLTDPDFVEQQLESGRIDCAAMSRQLIADSEWVNKTIEGRTKEIYRCVRCNKACLGGIQSHQGVHCIFDKADK